MFSVTTFNILCLYFWHMNYNVAWGVCSPAMSICAGIVTVSLDVPWLLLSAGLFSEISVTNQVSPPENAFWGRAAQVQGSGSPALWVVAVPAVGTCDAAARTLHSGRIPTASALCSLLGSFPPCTVMLVAFSTMWGPGEKISHTAKSLLPSLRET